MIEQGIKLEHGRIYYEQSIAKCNACLQQKMWSSVL